MLEGLGNLSNLDFTEIQHANSDLLLQSKYNCTMLEWEHQRNHRHSIRNAIGFLKYSAHMYATVVYGI